MILNEKPTARGILESSPLLKGLGEHDYERLVSVARVVSIARGEVIWSSGASVDFFGLAGTGFIKMVRSSAVGDVTIELMGPGQIFGLLGTVTGTGCPLSAVGVTDSWYARIPKSVFLGVYDSSLVLKDRLVRRSAVRFHGIVDLMARMSSGRVETRIAAILFTLAESYGERAGTTLRITVPLTRQEICEMAGTTVESTIRTMSRWQKQGILATDQHVVTILDEPRLSAILVS